jgi:type I restriction enzyme S subunit
MDLPIQDRQPGSVPVYGSNGVDGWHVATPLEGPGVITGRSGTIGSVYYSDGPYWPLNTTLYVRNFHGNHPPFIALLLESLRLERFTAATGVPSLNRNFVHPTPVWVPPYDEQIAAANAHAAIQLLIDKTEAVIAKLELIKVGLLHDLLTRGLDHNGQLRDPERARSQFQSWQFGLIPLAWQPTTLGSLVAAAGGRIQTGPFGSQLHAREYQAEGVPVVMPQDLQAGRILTEQVARVSQRKADELSRHKLVLNDVLIARRGDLSRSVAIEREHEGYLCGTGCLLLRVNPDLVLGEWFASLYQHDVCQRQIAARAVGSTMVNLNGAILKALVIPRVSVEEQRSIAQAIRSHDRRIAAETAALAKLTLLKQGLTHDLLTGRVRVPLALRTTP